MRVCTLFSARLVITPALAALFHPAFGHGLDEDTFSLLMHMQSNRLPALLAGYCADAPEASRARAEALTATVLSSSLSVEEICAGKCKDGDANKMSRVHVEAFIAAPVAVEPDGASCEVLLTWLASVQGRFGAPLGELLRQRRSDVPETIHELALVPGPVWRSDGGGRAIASLDGRSLKVQVNYEGVPLEARAMGDVLGFPAKEMPVEPYAFKVLIGDCGQCDKEAAAPSFERAVLRVRRERFSPVELRRVAETPASRPLFLVTFSPRGVLGSEPLELEVGPFREGETVLPPLVFRTEPKPAGVLRMPIVFFELPQLFGRKPELPVPAQQWQARQAQGAEARP